ncbi:MAG: hypothetical protein L3J39_18135 [Verrucomicrobiales bacterium]|nr:hypothetical protein [Verrucomicrobiales bacterium]
MKKLVILLHIIDNNTPESIGGGGVPRKPLAPKLIQVNEKTTAKKASSL